MDRESSTAIQMCTSRLAARVRQTSPEWVSPDSALRGGVLRSAQWPSLRSVARHID
jgi:hypothetical protein